MNDMPTHDVHLRMARTKLERRRIAGVFGFSISAGGVLGFLCYSVALRTLHSLVPIPFGLAASFMIGGFVGLLTAPFVNLALLGRDWRPARPFILWTAASVVAALSYLASRQELGTAGALSAGAFVAASVAARSFLPRIWDTPGLCRRCGFDIRASISLGRCPEYSTNVDEDPWDWSNVDAKPPQGFTRIGRFVLHRPELSVLLLALCFIVPAINRLVLRDTRQAALVDAITQADAHGGVFDLGSATAFDWDVVYVFGPYTSIATIQTALPFVWREIDQIGSVGEGYHLLLFVDDGKVAEWLEVPRNIRSTHAPSATRLGEFSGACCGKPIRREDAIFEIVNDEKGNKIIAPRVGSATSNKSSAPYQGTRKMDAIEL